MTEVLTEPSLLEWLRANTEFTTLDQLAIATGVELPTLRSIDAKRVLPSPFHVDAIKRSVPNIPVSLLNQHSIVEPESLVSPRGTLPEPSMSLNVGKIKDLQPGDYVSYVPRLSHERRAGSHWVEVISVTAVRTTSINVNFGGVERNYSPEMSIRFARRA